MTITHRPKAGAVLTGTEYEAEDAHIFAGSALLSVATVTLTDAQIKALPTTPVVIIPATETLGYSGTPTQMFMPVHAYAVLDNTAGVYSNVDTGACYLQLVFGSDWSDDSSGQNLVDGVLVNDSVWLIGFQFPKFNTDSDTTTVDNLHATDNFQDNALAIVLSNGGNLTGGNAANTLKVTVYYVTADL